MYQVNITHPTIDVKNGQYHPNSLRHLEPHHAWDIYIDETGNQFGEDKTRTGEKEIAGKLIALIIPKGKATLPVLSEKFHAVDVEKTGNGHELDAIIQTILSQPVGVLGLSYKDQLSYTHPNWFSGVMTLIQLVLRLLPLTPPEQGKNNSVNIYIEQRDFHKDTNFNLLKERLKIELKSINKERFKQFGLNLKFIGKEEGKYNGYVDTLAHCWGGGTNAQQRRKLAEFTEHCFLNQQETAIERYYYLIDGKRNFTPAEWYYVMSCIQQEPEHSILHDELIRLSKVCKKNEKLWQSYVYEVQLQLQQKNYQAHALEYILNWLDKSRPKGEKVSLYLQFKFKSVLLAGQNHTGQYNPEQFDELFQLGNSLYEEIAPDVANAYLRLSVAKTNIFEFNKAYSILESDVFDNTIAIGRLNHAKRLSSLGQIFAFQYDSEKAKHYFKRALAEIKKLKDPEQVNKEYRQTDVYALLNFIDSKTQFDTVKKRILEHFKYETLETLTYDIALAQDEKKFSRFEHHALLRFFVAYPKECHESIQVYLKHSTKWLSNKGHPWQAIQFWRGWLLMLNKQKEKSQQFFDLMLNPDEKIEDNTLLWIYLIYSVAIKQLGFKTSYPIEEIEKQLLDKLPCAPHNKLQELKNIQLKDIEKIQALIAECLPFNFK